MNSNEHHVISTKAAKKRVKILFRALAETGGKFLGTLSRETESIVTHEGESEWPKVHFHLSDDIHSLVLIAYDYLKWFVLSFTAYGMTSQQNVYKMYK